MPRLAFPSLLIMSLGLLPSCSRTPSATSPGHPGEGTRRMAGRLAQLARDSDVQENPFMNLERAERLRAVLERSIAPQEYFDLQPDYADELMKGGRVEESIQAFLDLQKAAAAGATSPNARNKAFMRHHLALAYLRLGEQENCQAH